MAGKSKGAKSKAKAQAESQGASVEPEAPVADVVQEAKPENGQVTEPAPAADGGAADVEKEEGDAAVAAQAAEKPAEGEDTRLFMS
jgi:hypothetical protein